MGAIQRDIVVEWYVSPLLVPQRAPGRHKGAAIHV